MSDKQETATVDVETVDAMKAASEATAAMEAGAGNGKPKGKRPAVRASVPDLGPKVAGGLTPAQIKAGQDSAKASKGRNKAKPTPEERAEMERQAGEAGAQAAQDIIEADREAGKGSTSPAKASGRKKGGSPKPEPKASEPASQETAPASEEAKPEPASGTKVEPLAIGTFVARIEHPASEAGEIVGTIEAPVSDEPLTEAERERLASNEALITAGVKAYWQSGAALLDTYRNGLYREGGRSFDEYLKAHPDWDLSARNAHYLMRATEVRAQLALAGETELPETESAARPLATVPVESRPEVWKAAKDEAKADGADKPQRKHTEAAAVKSGKSTIGSKGGSTSPSASSRKGASTDARVKGAVNSGVISEGTEIKTTIVDEGEAQADQPLSDDAWLETLNPIRDRLTVDTRKAYDFDALSYRALEVVRIEMLEKHINPRVKKAEKTLKDVPPYIGRLWWALKTNHPLQWKVCDSCNGTGHINKSACTDCRRRGYHV